VNTTSPPERAGIWPFLRVTFPVLLLLGAIAFAIWSILSVPSSSAMSSQPLPQLPLYGVNFSPDSCNASELNTHLDRIEAAWTEPWIRLRFHWADVEPVPGQYKWEELDQIIDALRGRSLHLMAVLETSPEWARAGADVDFLYAPPLERRDFGLFVAACVERYGDVIDAYQIWDEPNIYPHWGSRHVDAAEYVPLLREGAIQVRAGDPAALVLAGGLAPNTEPGGRNQSDIEFLRQMYAAGGGEWFDALAVKPYGLRDSPESAPDSNALNFQRVALLRQVMSDAGDREKLIWAVEFGWNSLPEGWNGEPSPWGTVDESRQVDWTAQSIELARREWPWMGPMLWAEWQPANPLTDPRWGFAALDPAGKPRAILDLFRALPAAPSVAGVGTHGFLEPSVALEGEWRLDAAGADIGADGSAMSIRFAGTDLDLTVRRGEYWAYLVVTIDGKPANALPKDENGQSYLVLYDPLMREATINVASGLSDGEHVARLVARGGWDQWALKSFTIREDRLPKSLRLRKSIFPIALVIGIAALLWLIWLAWRRQIFPAIHWAFGHLRAWVAWWQGRPLALRVIVLLAAGACYLLAPYSSLALVGLVVMAGLLLLWPAGGLALAALAIPFFPHPPIIFGYSLPGLELIIWLTAAALVANELVQGRSLAAMGRRLWNSRTWLDLGVALLLIAATLSTIAAQNVGVAGYEWRVVFVASILLYLLWRLMPAGNDEAAWVWAAMDALVAGGVAVALIAICQRVFLVDLITAEGVLRVRALYGSPNNLSLYLERIIPIALAVAAFGGVRRRRWAYGLAFIPLLIALFLTYSRGAWLLGLPAALLVMGLARGGKWRWGALVLVVVIVLALIPLAGTERLTGLFDFSAGTSFFRLKLWGGAWNMVKDHPWLGVGPDNFLYEYRTCYVLPSAWQELNLSHPHNIVLDTLTRLGLVGLAAMGVFLVSLFTGLLRLSRGDSTGADKALFIGLLGSMTAFLAHGLIDNSFFLVDLALVCMMTAGVVARNSLLPAREKGWG